MNIASLVGDTLLLLPEAAQIFALVAIPLSAAVGAYFLMEKADAWIRERLRARRSCRARADVEVRAEQRRLEALNGIGDDVARIYVGGGTHK